MASLTRFSRSRLFALAAFVLAFGCAGATSAVAQTVQSAPLDPGLQTQAEMPRMDMQNVQPARQQLLGAIQQLRNDQQGGTADQSTIVADQIAIIEARREVIEAQLLADQVRMPQAPADVLAIMQARGDVLRAEEGVGAAQAKLLDDQRANNTGAFPEDVTQVRVAQQQSLQMRRRLVAVQTQIRDLQPPTDPQ